MKKYEILVFDADGTLLDYEMSEKVALTKTLKEIGIEITKDIHEHYRNINAEFWTKMEAGEISVSELRILRFEGLLKKIGFDKNIDIEYFSDKYLSYLAEGNHLILGAKEICEELSKKYKIVILTNGIKNVQLKRIKESGIEPYISHIITSEEAGIGKPSVDIFKYMFEKINYSNVEKMIIIGDSITSDIKGGNNIGMDTCHYNPSKKSIDNNVKITYSIEKLSDLRLFL